MRASQGRESVFTRPAHLDALIARLDAGESSAEDDEDSEGRERDRYSGWDRHSDRHSDRYEGCDRNDRYADWGLGGDSCTPTELEHELEDLSRELTVTNMQVGGCSRAHGTRAPC